MIEKFHRNTSRSGPFNPHNVNGSVHGIMGVRDCQIYCNEVSGEIVNQDPFVPLSKTCPLRFLPYLQMEVDRFNKVFRTKAVL
jgi:hypothetical protein